MASSPAAEAFDLTDLLTHATRALRRRWREQLEPWGIAPHHARALRLIVAARGLRPGVVAEELRITARSASDVVDALAGRGLVTRRADPADRRAVIVEATPAGAELAGAIQSSRRQAGTDFFAPLTPRQQTQLATLLARLLDPPTDSDNRSVPSMA